MGKGGSVGQERVVLPACLSKPFKAKESAVFFSSFTLAKILEPPQNGEVIMHLAESTPPEPIFKSIKIAGVDAACASRWMTIDRRL